MRIENDLLLKTLRKENTPRPPVWMMRQAGRYLPEYIKLREKYDFFTRVQTPELATEITLQPISRIGVDAAIIFSDILVIPQAMGLEVLMEEGRGPVLPKVISRKEDVQALTVEGAHEQLDYVYKALALTAKELNGKIPLIGFAGAPFTILCYMVEGKGSKTWDKAKKFCFTDPGLAMSLLDKITSVTIEYLKQQVNAGADVVQVFDSWSGCLSPADFKLFSEPYLKKIASALSQHAPVILFPKGSWYGLADLSRSDASALGVDWNVSPETARELTNNSITLQGNFDPAKLLLPPAQIRREVHAMIDAFGAQNYIANLGHGITPDVPVENAIAFVQAVKEYEGAQVAH